MAAARKLVLRLSAPGFGLSAPASLLFADQMAAGMGIFLNGVNGYSQFYAIHVGVWPATACLALFAARPGEPPVLGNITAMFVLAQPAGRFTRRCRLACPRVFC